MNSAFGFRPSFGLRISDLGLRICALPVRPLPSRAPPQNFIGLLARNAFVKRLVAHHHRRGAATAETLDKFNRKLAVFGRLRSVPVRIERKFGTKVPVQFISATQRTTQRPANPEVVLAHRALVEHWIER